MHLSKYPVGFAGMCQQSLVGHAGPIFSLKWNRKGDLLLTGSLDKTAIVWTKAGAIKQQFSFHSGPPPLFHKQSRLAPSSSNSPSIPVPPPFPHTIKAGAIQQQFSFHSGFNPSSPPPSKTHTLTQYQGWRHPAAMTYGRPFRLS